MIKNHNLSKQQNITKSYSSENPTIAKTITIIQTKPLMKKKVNPPATMIFEIFLKILLFVSIVSFKNKKVG